MEAVNSQQNPPQPQKQKRDWRIFLSSVFFVLGFSVVFSLVGVLLQTVFAHANATVEEWLGYIGGLIIILFGLFLLGVIKPKFLEKTHAVSVKKRFGSYYATSFVFGAAFAVGWTPCVSAALGAIIALAATQAVSAFLLLFSYTLGIGIPFLLVGLFTAQAESLINKAGKWLTYFEYFFGALLVLIGIFIFTGDLSKIANFQFLAMALDRLNFGTNAGGNIDSLNIVNAGIAFIAGLGSFLSPCILPIIPGFLSYLASTAIKKVDNAH
jgi:cytochrome c-type biogenesis protein